LQKHQASFLAKACGNHLQTYDQHVGKFASSKDEENWHFLVISRPANIGNDLDVELSERGQQPFDDGRDYDAQLVKGLALWRGKWLKTTS
jgi:hypothetical protein